MEKMLTTKQAADFLGVSVITMKRLRKNGTLKPVSVKDNGYSLYFQEQLEIFKKSYQSYQTRITKSSITPIKTSINDTTLAVGDTGLQKIFANLTVKGFVQSENVTPSTYDIVQPVTQNNENVIGFKYSPPPETGDTKKATDYPFVAQNNTFDINYNNENFNVKGLLNNLPTEIKFLPRFIPVRDDGKTPRGKEWQKSENQKSLAEIVTSNSAFFIKGEPNILALDFDHVLNTDGTFANAAAQDFYNYLCLLFPKAYSEKSASGTGLHFLFQPTDNVFETIHKTLKFDSGISCLEVFYNFNKTITLTGNLFNCAANAPIPTGEVVDDFVAELLQKIARQNGKKYRRYNSENSFADSDEYQKARALKMLDCIQISQLNYFDWLSVMTSCKNLGIEYSIVDAKNAQDSARYNADKNLATWNSINVTAIGMANLHAKAKMFGYIEKDFFNEWRKNHSDFSRSSRTEYNSSDFEEHNNQPATTKAVIADCPIDLNLPSYSAYRFKPEGILRYVTKSERFVTCCHTPVVVTKRFILQPTKKIQYEISWRNHADQWQFEIVDADFIADSRKVVQLANFGVGITSTDAKYLAAFLTELINFDGNKSIIPTQKIYSQIGWRDSKCKQFILPTGGNLDGENYIVKRGNYNYEEIFATQGNKKDWFENYLGLLMYGANIRLIFGAALVAPLVKPLNLMNAWLHIHGTSNNGKTLVTKAAVSVFGNPELKFLGRTLDASRANFQSVAVGLNDFPKYFDEMESLPKKAKEDLPNWIYNFSGGISGQRNKRNGEERETSFFSGTIFTTGESPLLSDNSKRGAFKRLLEIKLDKLSDDQTMRRYHKFFEKNFGHFGAAWIQYITENLESLQKDFDALLDSKFQSDALDDYDATNLKVIFACQFALQKFFTGVLEKFNPEMPFVDLHTETDLQEILKSLPTISQIDDSERAWLALADFVNSHPKNFVQQIQPTSTGVSEVSAEGYETYGKIYRNGDVCFIPTQLTKIVEDNLKFSSCKKLLTEWNDNGKLKNNGKRCDTTQRLNGKSTPVIYCLKLVASTE